MKDLTDHVLARLDKHQASIKNRVQKVMIAEIGQKSLHAK
jgi:hypothetical protein